MTWPLTFEANCCGLDQNVDTIPFLTVGLLLSDKPLELLERLTLIKAYAIARFVRRLTIGLQYRRSVVSFPGRVLRPASAQLRMC